MSGRVIVATLHDRAVFPYQHDYSVEKKEDGRFYVAHAGTWELIPGQPAPPSPPEKRIDITYDWQGDGIGIDIESASAQWTPPPKRPAPPPEPEPISWKRIHELRKRLAELNGKES